MKSSSMNVRDADSSTTDHKFPWKWRLSDLEDVPKNGKTVFSCFSCGGGSSMGYKLAGYKVVGNCEIDEAMIKVYRKNHHPQYSYLMDIRDFNERKDYPDELKNLDILDGSPPCSVFSVAGDRERAWGREKAFREGQKKQRLDDLFLHFIRTAEILKPKVVIAENVAGLLKGNARGYVNELLIAHRNDLDLPKLKLDFQEKPILFGMVRSEHGIPYRKPMMAELIGKRKKGDTSFADISIRERGKRSMFNNAIVDDNRIAPTNVANATLTRFYDGEKYSDADYIATQTFPEDYDFVDQSVEYVCGMSVPPVMMAQISSAVYEQWLKWL